MATLTFTTDAAGSRVTLTLTWDVTVTTATVERVDPDGGVRAVRNATPATLVAGQWVGDDYEAPLDRPVIYRATSTDDPGVIVESAEVTLPSNGVSWLKHPGKPYLNLPVEIAAMPTLTRAADQGVFAVLGRARPIAVSSTRRSEAGELAVNTSTSSAKDSLVDLLADGATLLLEAPGGYGIGTTYVAIGEVSADPVSHVGTEWERRWRLPFVVVDRPEGAAGGGAGTTWSDALGYHASWSALLTVESTWTGLVEGVGPPPPPAGP